MTTILQVTLDVSKSPPCLDVSQLNNANHISSSPNVQTIGWQMIGNAAQGAFNSQSSTPPGFVWVGTAPKAGIFGTPQPGTTPNELSITDMNNSVGTTGEWTYQLAAMIGGVLYQSDEISTAGHATNPTIKNT